MSKYKPAEVFPPGEYLLEELDALSPKGCQSEYDANPAEEVMEEIKKTLWSELINGNIPITPRIAEVLEECTGSSLWMRLDKQWQEYKEEKRWNDDGVES